MTDLSQEQHSPDLLAAFDEVGIAFAVFSSGNQVLFINESGKRLFLNDGKIDDKLELKLHTERSFTFENQEIKTVLVESNFLIVFASSEFEKQLHLVESTLDAKQYSVWVADLSHRLLFFNSYFKNMAETLLAIRPELDQSFEFLPFASQLLKCLDERNLAEKKIWFHRIVLCVGRGNKKHGRGLLSLHFCWQQSYCHCVHSQKLNHYQNGRAKNV